MESEPLLDSLRSAVTAMPDDVPLRLHLAALLLRAGQRDEAVRHPGAALQPHPGRGGLTLADVAGLTEVKQRLEAAFLAPMRNPELRKLYGKSLRGGLLLYGPPGCGKTFIARAVAGELGARFITVSFADLIDMFVGRSERNIHELFEVARRNAPCVLFLDQVDAIAQKPSHP